MPGSTKPPEMPTFHIIDSEYRVTIRITDRSRRAWFIIGTLIRIARAMDIYRDVPGERAFLTQIRRRLCSSIASLDVYCSFDRGSIPSL
ncbi:hypothetical protein DOTSEDRAFT_74575, partial [Dothistroma septosporum NZE10]